MTTKNRNPIKDLAIKLAHQMDDEKRLRNEFLSGYKEKEIRLYGRYIRDEILKKGYDIQLILHYVEEYKMLKMDEYLDWINK